MVWITVNSTTPKPKNTDRTAPILASSDRRVRCVNQPTHKSPKTAESAEPIIKPTSERPSPPSATMTIKAIPTPGRVAWLIASLTSARLRKNKNVPVTPAAAPKSAAPMATSVALYPICRLSADSRSPMAQPAPLRPSSPASGGTSPDARSLRGRAGALTCEAGSSCAVASRPP